MSSLYSSLSSSLPSSFSSLFEEWILTVERPPFVKKRVDNGVDGIDGNGVDGDGDGVDGAVLVPDYSHEAALKRREHNQIIKRKLEEMKNTLSPLSPSSSVCFRLFSCHVSGFEFEFCFLRPWARDPAYYQSIKTEMSDTPTYEGPVHHALVELWRYQFPLSTTKAVEDITLSLNVIKPLLEQAKENLKDSTARDLWITGTNTMKTQIRDLEQLIASHKANTLFAPSLIDTSSSSSASSSSSSSSSAASSSSFSSLSSSFLSALTVALSATTCFVSWLSSDASLARLTGASGVGVAAYNWSNEHVHLVPYTHAQEVEMLTRELKRAQAALAMETAANDRRGLPALTPVTCESSYISRCSTAITKYMSWLSSQSIVSVVPELEPALRAQMGHYVPVDKPRHFFWTANHLEPITLFAHFYHWFDHVWMNKPYAEPESFIRRAQFYNIWDSRAEGMATWFEEMILQMGYYDDNPRAREIVYILLCQRCARGLASLHVHANVWSISDAHAFQCRETPRNWMTPDQDLLHQEQQLYLRQPGYGTSYVVGKVMMDSLLADYSSQTSSSSPFSMRSFLDAVNSVGLIPITLIREAILPPLAAPEQDKTKLAKPSENGEKSQ